MLEKFKYKIKKVPGIILRHLEYRSDRRAKCDYSVKIEQRALFNYYQHAIYNGMRWKLSDVGFRIYSQFEEDGILLYIFAAIGAHNKTFVDIGSSDGINSNCANLAINFGWHGLFIDGNKNSINRGRSFYGSHQDTFLYPPEFIHAFIMQENINDIIRESGFTGIIDLVSIDIDGNDYWVWDALSVIEPRVVIVETNIRFGLNSIVVPYNKDYSHPRKHPYSGASPVAMAKLAERKGYRLVGAINYGFNSIYIKNGIAEDIFPKISVESILSHPLNAERLKQFELIKDWDYIRV